MIRGYGRDDGYGHVKGILFKYSATLSKFLL